MYEEPPVSHDDLRDLFTHLDTAAMSGTECDHTFKLTRAFLMSRSLPEEPIIAWLGENGAGCDCEVMFNTAQRWEDVVGYVPPDEDA